MMATDAMALLNRVISPTAFAAEEFDWHEILAALDSLPASASELETRELVLRLLEPGPEISLRPGSQIPHIMSPRDMIRMTAAQMVRDEDIERARPQLERIASEAFSETLRVVAARRLHSR